MIQSPFNIIKHDVDLGFLEAWHHDINVVGKLGEFYFKRYGLFLEGKGGDFSDFVLGLYWLSKARNEGIFIAYIWIVKMVDAYSKSYSSPGYEHMIIEQFKKNNPLLSSYVCDDKNFNAANPNIDKINLAQFFLEDVYKFGVAYLDYIRTDYIVKASEHGYAYGDYQDYSDKCTDDYDEDEKTIVKPNELGFFFAMKDYLKNVFGGKYNGNTLVQDFKSDLLDALDQFGNGEEIDNDFCLCFTNEWETGHNTLEIDLRVGEIQFYKHGYVEGEWGGDSYTDWQCSIFLNGELDTDIDLDTFKESIENFVNESTLLSIMGPNWYSYEEDFDSCEDKGL